MADKTHYNLGAAIESWRQELEAQPNLTASARRELEGHLREAVGDFQRRGLTDEEAFWLARRRVGQPKELAEEFFKANPAEVWRERIFWIATAFLLVSLWTQTINDVITFSWDALQGVRSGLRGVTPWYLSMALHSVPVFAVFIYLARRGGRAFSIVTSVFQARLRFVLAALLWLTINETLEFYLSIGPMHELYPFVGLSRILGHMTIIAIWPLALIALIAWLNKPAPEARLKHA